MAEKISEHRDETPDEKTDKAVQQDKAARKKSRKKKAASGKKKGENKIASVGATGETVDVRAKPSSSKIEDAAVDIHSNETALIKSLPVAVKTPLPSVGEQSQKTIFAAASQILAMASLALAGMIVFAIAFKDAGLTAVRAFSGLLPASNLSGIEPNIVSGALFLDLLLPISYASGLALFAYAHNRSGMRPLVRMIAGLVIFAAGFDIAENLTIFQAAGGQAPLAVHWFTGLKYGLLAIGSVLLSVVMDGKSFLVKLARLLLRLIFPALVAALLSGLLPEPVQPVVTIIYLIGMLVLCLIANAGAGASPT